MNDLKKLKQLDMPIVSVIIPTYNTRQQLLDMVECMRTQTLQNWELIIVDDKSMDGSLEYIKSIITDERIKIVVRDREPKGSVVCRNIGFELASGKYVIHFDADDLISQKCVQILFQKKSVFQLYIYLIRL